MKNLAFFLVLLVCMLVFGTEPVRAVSDLEAWCTANGQSWDGVGMCTIGLGIEIIGGPQTILSGEFLVNKGTLTMNYESLINNDGEINNLGNIWNVVTINNDGTIYNNGDIYNDGTIDNHGTVYNNGNIWNVGTINNDGTIRNQRWNNGIILNYDTINNNGTIWNNSIIYNMGAITVNPVNNFDLGVVYEMHNHVHLPLIMPRS